MADDVKEFEWLITMARAINKRYFCVEIDFDTPINFAEQDRLACVVLERLVDDYWTVAALETKQRNYPVTVVAYRISKPRR